MLDKLAFSYEKPLRYSIDYFSSGEEDNQGKSTDEESPVSSISDQYSTDVTFSLDSSSSGISSGGGSGSASSDGILNAKEEIIVISDDEELVPITDEDSPFQSEEKFKADIQPMEIKEAKAPGGWDTFICAQCKKAWITSQEEWQDRQLHKNGVLGNEQDGGAFSYETTF